MGEGSGFWRFSLALYGRPGVPAACVGLQDAHGLDVNLMLFALWLASRGRSLSAADILAADAAVGPWRREAVIPLRGVRRFLKDPPGAVAADGADALRQRVKAIELEAERLQQEALFALRPIAAWGAPAGDAHVAAHTNMDACAQAFDAVFAERDRTAVLAAFAELVPRAP